MRKARQAHLVRRRVARGDCASASQMSRAERAQGGTVRDSPKVYSGEKQAQLEQCQLDVEHKQKSNE